MQSLDNSCNCKIKSPEWIAASYALQYFTDNWKNKNLVTTHLIDKQHTRMIFLEHLGASFSESRMKGHSYSSLLYSYEKSSIFLIQISFSSQKCWRLYPKRILGVVFMCFFSFITCYYPVALVKLGSVIYSTQSNLSEKSWP